MQVASLTKTIAQVFNDYQVCLTAIDQLEAIHATNAAKLTTMRSKIESWLMGNGKDLDVPVFVIESNPSLAWAIGKKTEGFAVTMHMRVDDEVLPSMKQAYEATTKPLEDLKKEIEQWGLQQMLERKIKNFSSDEGTASLRTDVKYQIADKGLFVAWAVKNKAESELTITLRPNSKFMGQVVEDAGELPSGVSSFREQKCVFIRSKQLTQVDLTCKMHNRLQEIPMLSKILGDYIQFTSEASVAYDKDGKVCVCN